MNEDAFAAKPSLDARLAAAPYLALAVVTTGAFLFLAGATAVGVAPAHSEHFATAGTSSTPGQDDAVQVFLDQRYSAAYGRFAPLADESGAASALIAVAMTSRLSRSSSAGAAPSAQPHRWWPLTTCANAAI